MRKFLSSIFSLHVRPAANFITPQKSLKTMAAQYLALDSFWVDRSNYAEAEQKFYERLGHETLTPLVAEFVKARETIKEMKRQANEAADAFADVTAKDTKNDNQGKKKQKQKAQKEQAKAEKQVEPLEIAPEPLNVAPVEQLEEISQTIQPKAPEVKPKECPLKQEQTAPQKALVCTASQAQSNVGCNITAMDCEPVKFLEKKLLAFTDVLAKVQSQLEAMDARLSSIEARVGMTGVPYLAVCPAKPPSPVVCPAKPKTAPACAKPADDDDDDVDLFGSESEDDEAAAKIKEERLAAYNAKKSKKPALIAKSSIILDVKPWDDETDMKKMEEVVRKVECDGLLWGASKLVPLAYGIKKLQITCVVEDDKVSIDWLQEQIESNEDFVQSVDIAAFNKI